MAYNNSRTFQYDKSKLKGVQPPLTKSEIDRNERMAWAKRQMQLAANWPEPVERNPR